MVGLGFLSGDTESSASGVSADGSVVVGQSGLVRPRPFVWDSINGMQSLESILASHGVNTTGWKLQDITDVTPDGVTVVGMGLNPSGQEEAFIATIPEPAALSLLCLAVPLAAWRRRPRAAAGRGL